MIIYPVKKVEGIAFGPRARVASSVNDFESHNAETVDVSFVC